MITNKVSVALTLVFLIVNVVVVLGRPSEEVKSGSIVIDNKNISVISTAVVTSTPVNLVSKDTLDVAANQNGLPPVLHELRAKGTGSDNRQAKCFGYKGLC